MIHYLRLPSYLLHPILIQKKNTMMMRGLKMLTTGKENGKILRVLPEGVICPFPFAALKVSSDEEQYFRPGLSVVCRRIHGWLKRSN